MEASNLPALQTLTTEQIVGAMLPEEHANANGELILATAGYDHTIRSVLLLSSLSRAVADW